MRKNAGPKEENYDAEMANTQSTISSSPLSMICFINDDDFKREIFSIYRTGKEPMP